MYNFGLTDRLISHINQFLDLGKKKKCKQAKVMQSFDVFFSFFYFLFTPFSLCFRSSHVIIRREQLFIELGPRAGHHILDHFKRKDLYAKKTLRSDTISYRNIARHL